MKKLFLVLALLSSICYAGSVTLTMENDTFAVKDDSDYSHGTDINYMTDSKFLWWFDNWGIHIQQNMYTPNNIDVDENQPLDRPYCGYLGGGLILDKYFRVRDDLVISWRNQFDFGVIGPASGVEQTQKLIHKLIGSKEPHWEYQLKNETVFEYQDYLDINYILFDWHRFASYLVPNFGLMLGEFKDAGLFGLDLVFGYNPPIEIGNEYLLSASKSKFRLYGKIGANTYYVYKDITIDGYHRDNYPNEVKHEDIVSDAHAGVSLSIWNLDFEYMFVYKTREYDTQDNNNIYGRISVTYNW